MQKEQGQKGFSLLELLFVMVIIAILAGVSFRYYRPYMNRRYCTDVEMKVHETMLKAVKDLAETGSATTNATQLGIDTGNVTISIGWDGSQFTVNGTDALGKCPKGSKYVLQEDDTTGTWR